MNPEYKTVLVAHAHTVCQYSPDGFQNTTKTLILKPETTVAELIAWWRFTVLDGRDLPFNGVIQIEAAQAKSES